MVLLAISISITLIIVIGLPIVASFWLNKKLGISWQVITYGVLGYFIVQILVSLLYSGVVSLIPAWNATGVDQSYLLSQILVNVFIGALVGVLVRWLGMKYYKFDTQESAYGLGVGYGGAESIMLVGLPLLTTFISMLSNMNFEAQSTSLDPAVVEQLRELWNLEFYVPLATAVERVTALIMHITVTLLIVRALKNKKILWVFAAFLLEFLINGLVVGLAEWGIHYGWVILAAVLLMVGNIYLIYRLGAFDTILNSFKKEPEIVADISGEDQA